jgi:O-methyltransferase
MSLRGSITQAIRKEYGRRAAYSQRIDRYNRLPLLKAFVSENAHVPSFPTREQMWTYLSQQVPHPKDYLEFGVHTGHSILYWAELDNDSSSRFFGFDSFRGLPEEWNKAYPKGHFDTNGLSPETTDHRVEFISGLFQDCLPQFLRDYMRQPQLIVNLDCDLYTSSLFCLTQLNDFITPGTVLIFDEFGDVLHEFRAFHDYISAYRRRFQVISSHDNFFTVALEILQ